MGNSKSKKLPKEPTKFFERERLKEQRREEKKRKKLNHGNKRVALKENPLPLLAGNLVPPAVPPGPGPTPSPAHIRSYDTEALERMRRQLHNDSDAFLLNNILLSIQFFENYEREVRDIKNNPISEREHMINEAMVRHHKHVFFADRMQECVHEHVIYQRERGQVEPLAAPRFFVIYDNVEASEPGDTSDYSAVLDAPFYKLCVEDCKFPGYIKLKKLEVLESAQNKESVNIMPEPSHSDDDSLFTDSERESIASDDFSYDGKGEAFLQKIETKLSKPQTKLNPTQNINFKLNNNVELPARRSSGPTKHLNTQAAKSNIINMPTFKRTVFALPEETSDSYRNGVETNNSLEENDVRPRKSILKNSKRSVGPIIKEIKSKQNLDYIKAVTENTIAEDTETSGYATSTSRQSSGTESDYGYATITQAMTPKKLEMKKPSNYSMTSGVVPEECWCPVHVRAINNWSDDEDEELNDSVSRTSISRNLYETKYYLGSLSFMNNFSDNFIINLGSSLGLTQEAINNAMTQGASIYCDTTKNGTKMGCEIFPALVAKWPNAANQWIIRERRIIQNPRTNFSYQWPTKYMVSKAVDLDCLVIPTGYRPKREKNPEEPMQWRIIFPAAERYLESCLAHSHIRCYLFALLLNKTFMQYDNSKVGIDASHIKNHLFWQCEDNYAKWPEDRLGETLRIFLRSFYVYFGQGRLPNYFMENCNDFQSIPGPLLRKNQRSLADILESPVLHVLSALDKLKYTKKDFYPRLNCYRLYEILTCKNPLRILNPSLPAAPTNNNDSSDESDDDNGTNFWEKVKTLDIDYQWKKRQQQIQQRRKAQSSKQQKTAVKQARPINTNIKLSLKLEAERRRLVLDFFIRHFIAMARSSERFEAIRQAVIYLEQAQRLCVLFFEEPSCEDTANGYLEIIREKLADCQRKLVNQVGFKLPRRESQVERSAQRPMRRLRPQFEQNFNQDSPTADVGISAFTFVDVHIENNKDNIRFSDTIAEESKL